MPTGRPRALKDAIRPGLVARLDSEREPTTRLEPYQTEGVAHLLRRPDGGLLMDPGTGKTLTVLMAFHLLRKRGIVSGLVVFAPEQPAHEVWGPESEKHGFPFKVVVLHGPNKDRLVDEPADIYVVNYGGVAWFAKVWPRLRKQHKKWWGVADESTKIKYTNTKRFKALAPVLPDFARRGILTGTPAPRGLIDLFGQVKFQDLGARLGQYITQYRRAYFYQTGYGGYTWAPQTDAEERIYAKLADIEYRVSEDVLKLKPLRFVQRFVDLPPKARALYEEFEREFIVRLGSVKLTAANAGVLSSKLRQIAGGAVYDEGHKARAVHEAKLEAVSDLVEQLQGNPLLLGYEFTHHGEALAKHFKAPVVKGGMPRAEVKAILADFNAGNLPVVVCQYETVALGLNLQDACHNAAFYGLPWNLETIIQFVRRVHRKGQQRPVFVHQFLARGTIDELSARVTEKKNATQQKLLDALKNRYME
jgi:hypothetical protein